MNEQRETPLDPIAALRAIAAEQSAVCGTDAADRFQRIARDALAGVDAKVEQVAAVAHQPGGEPGRTLYAVTRSMHSYFTYDAELARQAQFDGASVQEFRCAVVSQHPDDVAVDAFAAAMKTKLAEARAKGRGGWQDKGDCPQQRLSGMLRACVEKGDPRDVANLCMFLHQRDEAILPRSMTMLELATDPALRRETSTARPSPEQSGLTKIGFRHRIKGERSWGYNYHRDPDSFELAECDIENVWAESADQPRA
ncbi:MAG: hypothetical protein EPN36_13980 [Rhodanobacteraceae bacterium]|nr:MAG: hypothetical protein EPN36_13980 [Rhodanobacteraceae bacterium]